MSESPNHKRESAPSRIVPAPSSYAGSIEIDCSSWDADPGEVPQESQPLKSAAIHAGSFDLEFVEAKSIEIVMNVSGCSSREEAFQLATKLIEAVTQSAPELELLYDPDRTRAVQGQLTIVLTPQVSLKDDQPLRELVERINHSKPKIGPGQGPNCRLEYASIAA